MGDRCPPVALWSQFKYFRLIVIINGVTVCVRRRNPSKTHTLWRALRNALHYIQYINMCVCACTYNVDELISRIFDTIYTRKYLNQPSRHVLYLRIRVHRSRNILRERCVKSFLKGYVLYGCISNVFCPVQVPD